MVGHWMRGQGGLCDERYWPELPVGCFAVVFKYRTACSMRASSSFTAESNFRPAILLWSGVLFEFRVIEKEERGEREEERETHARQASA